MLLMGVPRNRLRWACCRVARQMPRMTLLEWIGCRPADDVPRCIAAAADYIARSPLDSGWKRMSRISADSLPPEGVGQNTV